MTIRLKGIAKFFFRLGVSIALLVWLISHQEKAQLAAALKAISPMAFVLAFSMYILSQVVSARRWQIISHSLGFYGDFATYLKYYFVGMYFNLFLPTGVGGDLLKIIYLTQERPERLKATYTILMDRTLGLGAMVGIGGMATFFLATRLPHHFDLGLRLMGTFVVVLIVLLRPLLALVKKLSPTPFNPEGLLSLMHNTQTIVAAFSLSIIIQGLGMGAIALLGMGMGIKVEIAYYFSIFPLVALAILLPISFNGIGVREGGFIYFMGLRGVPQEQALTLGLSFFAIQVISSLIGGIIYGLGLHRR